MGRWRANALQEDSKAWAGSDLVTDTIPGMSVQKAYDEIIKDFWMSYYMRL